jgi:dihydrofolate reductase
MASNLVADLFLSVDGWAGSDGLPGYFGYLGPELQEWIDSTAAVPQRTLLGRRTYEMVSGLPDEARDASTDRLAKSENVVFSLDAGLVDRLRLMRFPLVAGPAGREAAFAGMASADLSLVDHRVLDGRVLLEEYAPTGRDVPRA